MTTIKRNLIMALTLSFLVVACAQVEPSALIVAAVAAVAISALLGSRQAALALVGHEITIGNRAREHRDALSVTPSPQHPDTAGRTRSRAPARQLPAA
ncbi:hypothetical protein [Homoserinimonas hongtaonis]|uniref:hypothetical protein n=1 Tax=Homoserinimonas hongtaonis TaxID=2079791 RepID=UPI000D35A725|nr:hypothetical protein [Salinibacterium hongtaonis]AWB89562.1 hypothetical protein C2138_08420 [Salinibacterium hongtaonis]